jgi:GH25 family lysozyme M1 (1,4-beta-N-acetylmuramidase)
MTTTDFPINRLVIDISVYNEITDWNAVKAAGIVGVIHKATEGGGFVDRTYALRKQKALDAGLLWGAYHFGNDCEPVDRQVQNFLSTAAPDGKTLLCLDYEPNGNHTMSLEQAREFMVKVEAKVGRSVVLYSGNLIKEQLPAIDPWWGGHRLWLAQYASYWRVPPSWTRPWLWQYSDGDYGPGPKGVPGVGGAVDCNSYAGTPQQLTAEWQGDKV